jgi:hypothetical protein
VPAWYANLNDVRNNVKSDCGICKIKLAHLKKNDTIVVLRSIAQHRI